MKYKYVVSNYDPVSSFLNPVAVFDDLESATEYARITFGATEINGIRLIDKVVSFLKGQK